MKKNKAIFLLVFFSLTSRFLLLFLSKYIPLLETYVYFGDAVEYKILADNLLNGLGFSLDSINPTSFRMPGYPIFLLIFCSLFKSPLPIQIIQIITESFSIILVYKITNRIIKNSIFSFLAGLLMVVHPLLILSSISLYPETLVLFTLIFTIYLWSKHENKTSYIILGAAFLALSIYLKPTMFVVAFGLSFLLAFRKSASLQDFKNSVSKSLVSISIIFAMLSPWIIRNYLVFNSFIPLTTSNGINMRAGNNPQANGGYVCDLPYIIPEKNETESSQIYTEQAKEWIVEYPFEFLKLVPQKIFRFIWPLSRGTSGCIDVSIFTSIFLSILLFLFYFTITMGLYQLFKGRNYWLGIFLITPFIILLFLSCMTFGAARFSLPGYPGQVILFVIGLKTYQKKFFPNFHIFQD